MDGEGMIRVTDMIVCPDLLVPEDSEVIVVVYCSDSERTIKRHEEARKRVVKG